MDWHSIIRVRETDDDPAIATTISAAFSGSSESAIVKALRRDVDMSLELVALIDDQIIGHIAYSRLKVTSTVLGYPNYYVRFGFSNLLARLLDAPYAGDAFMALELTHGCVRSQRWTVTYPRAFSG